MLRFVSIVTAIVSVVACLATDAQAQWRSRSDDGPRRGVAQPASVRLELSGDFFLHGDVSEDSTDPPSYSKAYGAGFGALVEFDYRVVRELSVHLRTGYLHHVGGSDGNLDFDPWGVMPVLVGVKLFPPIAGMQGVDLYGRLELGVGISQASDVEVSIPPFGSVSGDFYESSTLFLFGIGVGVAFSPAGSPIIITVEIGYRGFTGPEIDTGPGSPSDEGEMGGAFRLAVGIGVRIG